MSSRSLRCKSLRNCIASWRAFFRQVDIIPGSTCVMFPTLHTSHITLFLGVPVVGVATESDQATHQSIRSLFWNRDKQLYGEKVAPPRTARWVVQQPPYQGDHNGRKLRHGTFCGILSAARLGLRLPSIFRRRRSFFLGFAGWA